MIVQMMLAVATLAVFLQATWLVGADIDSADNSRRDTQQRTAEYLQGYDPAPEYDFPFGFKVDTLNGTFELNATSGYPLVIHCYLPQDAKLRYMWSDSNKATLVNFLHDIPDGVNFLFISYGNDSLADMTMMQSKVQQALADGDWSDAQKVAISERLHFAKPPMSGISDAHANFIPYLMAAWSTSRSVIAVQEGEEFSEHFERLDSPWDWIQAAPPSDSSSLVPFGDGCGGLPLTKIDGIALVLRNRNNCSVPDIIKKAVGADASAVIISSLPDEDIETIACSGRDCDDPVYTFATSVTYKAAEALQEKALLAGHFGERLNVKFTEETGPGYYAAIDHRGKLQEVGWIRFPTLEHLGWAAQWLKYRENLDLQLKAPALTVPIYANEVMQGQHGIVHQIQLPEEITQYPKLELDFTLSCPGTKDADCPPWDHVIQLFVCCGDESACPSCDPTVWKSIANKDDLGSQTWEPLKSIGAEQQCGRELGRWITPFRRRVGRWLTDVTPLKPLIRPGTCTFTTQTAPWAKPWKPSLSLRFSQHPSTGTETVTPISETVIPLFEGGTFDEHYNDREAQKFTTPAGLNHAIFSATITGHGSDKNNCAEFCVTEHVFHINHKAISVTFNDAGTLWNCTRHVLEGGVPNEHGTWQYGRGGWCDGINVKPHTFDVTDYLKQEGEDNLVQYLGLFNGKTPQPQGKPGYIMLQSSLTFYTRQPPDTNQITA